MPDEVIDQSEIDTRQFELLQSDHDLGREQPRPDRFHGIDESTVVHLRLADDQTGSGEQGAILVERPCVRDAGDPCGKTFEFGSAS